VFQGATEGRKEWEASEEVWGEGGKRRGFRWDTRNLWGLELPLCKRGLAEGFEKGGDSKGAGGGTRSRGTKGGGGRPYNWWKGGYLAEKRENEVAGGKRVGGGKDVRPVAGGGLRMTGQKGDLKKRT